MNRHPDPWLPTRTTEKTVLADPAEQVRGTPLMQRLPQLLRMAGATALLVATYSFLVQGWQDSNDLLRYAMLLGHSALLCALGLLSGHWLQEAKGARLLITLALASVPANFAILGAFIYADFGAVMASGYPQYALWQLGSKGSTLATVALGVLTLIPVMLLGFRTLARVLSTRLTILFLLSNALLLIPLRDPAQVLAFALPLAMLLLLNHEKTQQQHLAARTPDGLIARALLYLPLAVMAGRSLWLYDADAFLSTGSLLILFLAARQLSLLLPGQSILRGLLEVGSGLLPPMIGIGVVVLLERIIADSLMLPTAGLVCAGLLYELSRRVQMAPALYRVLAMLSLGLSLLGNALLFGTLATSMLCLACGSALVLLGRHYQQLALFSTGLLLAALSLIYQLYQLLRVFDLGGWLSVAALGMLAILIASALESGGGRIRPRLLQLRQRFARWEL
ncbi:hypothetical protein [Marinobacterium rhizophilum]|uniref:DUF4401 domain-containing protein n=1 Tax=Marinobacterium rhizophilum TaxID=420402 RepID=A0ABY5HJB1_9GAMM|nr:hypothetical protein [Marinobacterium rhizophilum]UTW11345.1 hypothetical protein KDW95_19080 [Marinobacterium rhizophilum]